MDTKQKLTNADVTASIEPCSIRPTRPSLPRIVQNYLLFWLDATIDEVENEYSCSIIKKLRQVVNTVYTFSNVNECINFLTDIKEETIFMIISEVLTPAMIPLLKDIPQISCIYIFCENTTDHQQWAQQCHKIRGIYTDITLICSALRHDIQRREQNMVSISFVKSSDEISKENLDQLDQTFMYTQILKEILLTIDFEKAHFDEFLNYYRGQFHGNSTEFQNAEKLCKEYHNHQPIWWYTNNYFLYSTLNAALRTMEVDLIIKMGFFVRDLHQNIVALYSEQCGGHHLSDSFTVYRGQGLSKTDFDQLMKTQGGLLSFNNFLSTSVDRAVSLAFAESNQYNSDLIGVLFKITINPSMTSTFFANVHDVSAYQGEEEILFSMHSVFRIGQITPIDSNNRLWQVDLTLTSETDPQLRALTKSLQEETAGSTGWHRLGKLMIKLAQYDKAEDLYRLLLDQMNNESEKGDIYYQLGCIMFLRGEYENAIQFYDDSLKICETLVSSKPSAVAHYYDAMGGVYSSMSDYSQAISSHEKALEIRQKVLAPNHPDIAQSYNNIGILYSSVSEYSKALSCYEKTLQIFKKTLPANHPDLAISYDNVGRVYDRMGEYSKALSYYEKALEIFEKTLPANHPDLATSYNNFGIFYYSMGEHSKAISSLEKALEIRQKTVAANHPDLAASFDNIGVVYNRMGKYSKALSSHEKALETFKKTLPENHPDLATSYGNIGWVYDRMGECSKALSYYEKALEIFEKTLPANHPSLAISYSNVGSVYNKMGEYSKALSSHGKALEIYQKTLPANHPYLATFYNNIGRVYDRMGEYSKALSYYEKALETFKKTLPAKHPDLATSYGNIGWVYNQMGEYSKALSYYEKALEIRQKTLPANHPDLAASFDNIGVVYNQMGEYSKALSFFEKSLEIAQKTLSANHPDSAISYKNIGLVYEEMGE